MGDLSSGGRVDSDGERSKQLHPRPLTVSMSRSRLFLGGLHSCIARFCFTSRFHHHASRLEM
jgi:hypothetical protein